MKILKINEGQRGAEGNYNRPRLLTASASAITWQSMETPSSFFPTQRCRVRLQHGRQQQPAHKNESRITINAAAAMRSNGPENRPAFSAARVKHQEHASTGTTSTARAPLQPHLHSPHATPRHTLYHQLSPVPYPIGRAHIGRRSSLSLARDRHTAERGALEHTEDVPRKWSRWGGSACC